MTEHIKISENFSFFLILWSSLQNISLIFTSYYYSEQTIGALFQNFISFLKIFQPLMVLKILDLNSLIILLYCFLIIWFCAQMIYFLNLHYHLREFKDRRYFGFHFPFLDLMKILTMIWLYVIFVPVFQIYYSSLFCFLDNFLNANPNIELPTDCQTCPIFFLILTVIFASPLVFYGFLSALFFSVEKFDMENNLSNSASSLNITYFFYKLFLVMINFQLSAISSIAMNAFLLIFQLILLKTILSTHNMYNFKVEKVMFSTTFVEFLTVIYLTFLIIINNNKGIKKLNFELLYFIILLLMIKISLSFYDYYLSMLLDGNFFQSKSLYLFDKKVRFLYYFILKQDVQNEIILYNSYDPFSYLVKGYFTNHSKKCINVECLCHSSAYKVFDYKSKKDFVINKENRSENFHNIIYIKHFLRYQYRIFTRNFRGKNSSAIKLKMSYFLFYVVNNYHKSVVECIEIKDLKHKNVLSLQEEFLLERLMMEMDLVLLNLNRNYDKNPTFSNLNFEELIAYESNYLTLERCIQDYALSLFHYFSSINDERPKFEDLSKQSSKLTALKREILNIYKINHNNPRTIAYYKEYLRGLLFNEDEEINMSKVLNIKNEKIQNYKRDGKLIYDVELMYNENSILIQISTTNTNLGNIVKANQGAAKYLGYSIEKLESSNINIIMPKRIHENHDRYLKNYMESGKGNVLYVERRLFLRKKDGFLSFISLITKPMFELKENLFKFIGYMQPLKDEYELIVTDETGLIDGMSRKLGLKLKIYPKDYEKEQIYIQNLCPSLAEYYFERANREAPVYVHNFDNHPKSSKMFPILKFFQYSNNASSFKYQIDSVMKSLGY